MTSLNSLAKNMLPELMINLVKHKIWTPVQALAYVLQMPTQRQRVSAIQQLIPLLSEELLLEVLKTFRSIENTGSRAEVLAALVPYLPEVGPEALAAARSIENTDVRAEVLAALAPHLPKELLPEGKCQF